MQLPLISRECYHRLNQIPSEGDKTTVADYHESPGTATNWPFLLSQGSGPRWCEGYPLPIRDTFVPQTAQVPRVAGLPFLSVTCAGLRISRLALHFMQYASIDTSRTLALRTIYHFARQSYS